MDFKACIKKFFSIQVILICFGLITLSFSMYYKNKASELFVSYEHETVNLILLNSSPDILEYDLNSKLVELKDEYYPFTYFDFSLEEKLDEIINKFKSKTNAVDEQEKKMIELELSSLILEFQDAISQKEMTLFFGYDSLMYCSSLLLLISILCIVFKTIKQRNQIKHIQLRTDEQQKISRNLHDGVAQDLAALKFYLQQDDKEKTDFYANQALNEVRYLIGALHIDLSEDFEKIIRQMLQTFESNYKIKTEMFVASSHMSSLPQTIQIEILRVLQESLSNIARHAKATQVTVKFTDVAQDFKFTISDNGIGFNLPDVDEMNKTDARKHYGIKNIQDRVAALGGTVEFVNNGGTTIAITIKNIIR